MESNQNIIEQDDLTGLNNLPKKKLQTFWSCGWALRNYKVNKK